ncbi:hypothetical protein PoB_006173600 [Plakobranchus ocellatus]|uniref:Uncharacterized protein n=1 Tax=Plakobranchus ocellatus TaxID=259542 RepID=A0AAV4CTK1_9GAST|nr:hypothetical protein PoB_006173600 [Plakobranchus ocellatus]
MPRHKQCGTTGSNQYRAPGSKIRRNFRGRHVKVGVTSASPRTRDRLAKLKGVPPSMCINNGCAAKAFLLCTKLDQTPPPDPLLFPLEDRRASKSSPLRPAYESLVQIDQVRLATLLPSSPSPYRPRYLYDPEAYQCGKCRTGPARGGGFRTRSTPAASPRYLRPPSPCYLEAPKQQQKSPQRAPK